MSDLSKVRSQFLGFNDLFRDFDIAMQGNNYPPTDVFYDAGTTQIQMALAGIPKESILVEVKDKTLTISGTDTSAEVNKRSYLSQCIKRKAFTRSYLLEENMEVESANLADGLLTVKIKNNPLKPNVKKIEIK